MYIEFKTIEDKLVAYLAGELDHHSAEEVRCKIDDTLDRGNFNKLIMDFSKVSFMDSSGIGVVIGRYKKLSLKKGNVSVTSVSKMIKKVFEISGMFKIIILFDNVEQALLKM